MVKFINYDQKFSYLDVLNNTGSLRQKNENFISSSSSWHTKQQMCQENSCMRDWVGPWRRQLPTQSCIQLFSIMYTQNDIHKKAQQVP